MNVKKLAGKGNELVLEISKASFSDANTLRRLMMNEVPIMSIEEVEFNKNSSIMYDEMLALRLGLVPLTTDLSSYTVPSEEESKTGEYTAKSSVKLTLEAKGPCIVYAKDLKSKDPKIKPVYPDMPITKLLEGQEIALTATAVLGFGKNHSKWSSGLVSYKQKPTIKIGDADTKAVMKNLSGLNLQAIQEKGGKLVVDEEKLALAESPEAYEDIDRNITVEYSTDTFIFTIESWGQLSPKEIVTAAFDQMQQYAKEFEKLAKAL